MTASSQTPPDAQPPPVRPALLTTATEVIAAAMRDGDAVIKAEDIAQAQLDAGILYNPATLAAMRAQAYEQAKAEDRAELAELGRQVAALSDRSRRLNAVMRLLEDRPGNDTMLVREIHGAILDGRTPQDDIPMTVAWNSRVGLPSGGSREGRAIVECTTAHGARADLVLNGVERKALASLLDGEIRDITAECATPRCGTADDLDASNPFLFGWSRLQVASLGDGPRWYCSDMCVVDALARAGHDLAADDRAAAVDPDEAQYLDARYGPGASDEYALQAAEATEAALDDDQAHDGDEGGAL